MTPLPHAVPIKCRVFDVKSLDQFATLDRHVDVINWGESVSVRCPEGMIWNGHDHYTCSGNATEPVFSPDPKAGKQYCIRLNPDGCEVITANNADELMCPSPNYAVINGGGDCTYPQRLKLHSSRPIWHDNMMGWTAMCTGGIKPRQITVACCPKRDYLADCAPKAFDDNDRTCGPERMAIIGGGNLFRQWSDCIVCTRW